MLTGYLASSRQYHRGMPSDPPEPFWGGFMLLIGPHLDRSKWVQAIRVVFIGGAAVAAGIAGKVHGVAAAIGVGVGALLLVLIACIETVRELYRSRLRDQDNDAAAAELVAVRSALRPIVESIADMHALQKVARRERAHNLAQRGAEALALVMQNGIPGFRSVVYRQDAAATVLSVSGWAGRPDRTRENSDVVMLAATRHLRSLSAANRHLSGMSRMMMKWLALRARTQEHGPAIGRSSQRQ